jgi:hypothetical protein
VPVAVVLDFEDATLDQYDQVVQKMGFQPGGAGAPGGLFHWVTETPNGFRVNDVWETREQFEAFADAKIGPLSQEAGMTTPPTTEFYEIHNHLTAG